MLSNEDLNYATFLLENEAEVNARPHEWVEYYGFSHECHCGRDFVNGKLVEVPECFTELNAQALETCAMQNGVLRAIASGKVADPIALAQEFLPYEVKEADD